MAYKQVKVKKAFDNTHNDMCMVWFKLKKLNQFCRIETF